MADNFLNISGLQRFWQKVKTYADDADAELQAQIDAIGEPFRLYDFNQQINVTLQPVSGSGSPVDVDVKLSDEMGATWAITSLAKYEVFNSASGGTRLNAIPVASFSMNGQKTLRIKMMCSGTSTQAAKRIQGAILLKHR